VRVLFYLPVMTPWWLENIVSPIIGAIEADCEVSAIVPSPWSDTGIPMDAPALERHPNVNWHYLEGERYRALRRDARAVPEILDLICDIDAAYTFCRSADTVSPIFFPGVVRFLMEYALPPLAPATEGQDFSLTGPRLFDRGFLPPMEPEVRSWLADVAARRLATMPVCARPQGHAQYRAAAGLPADKAIVACPLEFQSRENFFSIHRCHRDNAALLETVLSHMGEDCCLAVTRHPLTLYQGGDENVVSFIAAHASRIVEVSYSRWGNATAELVSHCDGVIVEDSKCIYLAALSGKPMLRISRFDCAEWMRSYTDMGDFFAAVARGSALVPMEEDVLAWFGYGLANDRINPCLPGFGWAELQERADRPYDPRRWRNNLDFYASRMPGA